MDHKDNDNEIKQDLFMNIIDNNDINLEYKNVNDYNL